LAIFWSIWAVLLGQLTLFFVWSKPLEWWQKAGLLSGLSVAFLGFVAQLFANDLAVPSKIVLVAIGIGTISVIFVLSWPVTPKKGAAVITKDNVIVDQPEQQSISRQEVNRIVANAVRNAVRGQGRGMSGEPNITSSELRRDEGLWYVEGSYAWQTGILQTVMFRAQINAKTGQVVTLTFDN
jgi:hypothetical protein